MPFLNNYHYIFYDGDCLLCNRAVRDILVKDKSDSIRAVPLQLLQQLDIQVDDKEAINLDDLTTIFLWSEGNWYTRSTAIYKLYHISGRTLRSSLIAIFPRFLRDGVYGLVSQNRKKLNTVLPACPTVGKELRKKYLLTEKELKHYLA